MRRIQSGKSVRKGTRKRRKKAESCHQASEVDAAEPLPPLNQANTDVKR
jgi:hypothetical protein